MLEFQGLWFVVLLVNFLVLVFILNLILFRPFLKVMNERRAVVNDALESARKMADKREGELAAMRRELELARSKAKELFEGLRAEGLENQRLALAKAHEEAMKRTEKIKQELEAEAAKARQALRAEAEKFSDGILEKLVRA
ncbi:MAG: hypothetical protein M0033_03675 [Nitrospiraceae bacterium]|nr:hypothetical protein [Nitrospiraceae bacterium]MDA8325298.1 hypothetical protein [Nitrospiraceae bacterium]